MSVLVRVGLAVVLSLLPLGRRAYADGVTSSPQEQPADSSAAGIDVPASSEPDGDSAAAETVDPESVAHTPDQNGGRMFGVMPNFSTIERGTTIDPISASRKFKLAQLNTFDGYTFAFVGVISEFSRHYGGGTTGFAKQYAASFADTSIGNFLTTGGFPSLLRQDPRYYERGRGSIASRIGYAFSRAVITHGDSGRQQLNVSELAGTGVAAAVSNLYYPQGQHTASATITRWGTQILWDALANELKEFWPDVRSRLHR
jgi:hypothetical protein